jgi:hypothetical protein
MGVKPLKNWFLTMPNNSGCKWLQMVANGCKWHEEGSVDPTLSLGAIFNNNSAVFPNEFEYYPNRIQLTLKLTR